MDEAFQLNVIKLRKISFVSVTLTIFPKTEGSDFRSINALYLITIYQKFLMTFERLIKTERILTDKKNHAEKKKL